MIDFGVAKATGGEFGGGDLSEAGLVIGTLAYMAPEQADSAADIDTRADVYALGVILYELLVGSPPIGGEGFPGGSALDMLRLVRDGETPRPAARLNHSADAAAVAANRGTEAGGLARAVRGDLECITLKALEKDRRRRYETASALAADVRRHLAGEPVLAHPPGAGYRLRKFARRNRGPVLAAALVAVAVAAGFVGTAVGLVEARRQEGRARGEAAAKGLALHAEAERAEGERLAKLDAERQKAAAQARLAQVERGAALLAGVFDDLNVHKAREDGERVESLLAERLVKAGAQLQGESLGDPLTVALLQLQLGESLRSLGFAKEAAPLLERAFATRDAALGPDHPATLDAAARLGVSYCESARYDLARPLMESTLARCRSTLGPKHPKTVHAQQNLAGYYRAVGDHGRAIELLRAAVEAREAELGADAPEVSDDRHRLACAYDAADRPNDAVPIHERTLAEFKTRLGPDHPTTLTTMNNLALDYTRQGRFDLALPLMEETLTRRTARLGRDHPHTVATLNNLALSYYQANDRGRAIPLFEQALTYHRAKFGPDHPATITSLTNLGHVVQEDGRPDAALPLFAAAVAAARSKLGAGHPLTLLCLNNQALGFRAAGDLGRALATFRELLPIVRSKFGPAHERTAVGVLNLATCLLELGDTAAGVAAIDSYVDGRRGDPGAGRVPFASELARFGVILTQAGEYAAAERHLRESLAIRRELQPGAWATANAETTLGEALVGRQKFAEAEPLLLAGYRGLKACEATIPPDALPRVGESLDRLAAFYDATGERKKADSYRELRARHPAERAPPPRAAQ